MQLDEIQLTQLECVKLNAIRMEVAGCEGSEELLQS